MRVVGWLSATLLAGMMAASPAFAGSWTFALEAAREAPTLRYHDGAKTTFFLACGHVFILRAKYPGQAKKQGLPATITIFAGKQTMNFKGLFVEPDEDLATTFEQGDLGYRRQDPDLYSKKWEALRDKLLDVLSSGEPLTISAGKDNYQLPPVDAKDWRKPFEGCG